MTTDRPRAAYAERGPSIPPPLRRPRPTAAEAGAALGYSIERALQDVAAERLTARTLRLAAVVLEVHPDDGMEPVRVTFPRRPEWMYLQVVTRFAWKGGPMLSSAVVLLDRSGAVMDCRSLYEAAQ